MGACSHRGKLPCKVGPAPSLGTFVNDNHGRGETVCPTARVRRDRNVGRSERWRGQALVEFALVIPVFMLILGGVIQFGIYFWDQNTLNQIVRDAGGTPRRRRIAPPRRSRTSTTRPSCSKVRPRSPERTTVTVTLPAARSGPNCPPLSNADVAWVSIKADATVPVHDRLCPGVDRDHVVLGVRRPGGAVVGLENHVVGVGGMRGTGKRVLEVLRGPARSAAWVSAPRPSAATRTSSESARPDGPPRPCSGRWCPE